MFYTGARMVVMIYQWDHPVDKITYLVLTQQIESLICNIFMEIKYIVKNDILYILNVWLQIK